MLLPILHKAGNSVMANYWSNTQLQGSNDLAELIYDTECSLRFRSYHSDCVMQKHSLLGISWLQDFKEHSSLCVPAAHTIC